MASMCMIYLSLLFSLLFCSIEGRNIPLTKEEDLELEKELQSLNKPPVKTLKSSFTGDLFDCIEIFKQPAFDHPALKNHKLQMRPSFRMENVTTEAKIKPLLDQGFNDTCPPGTVIIRRTRKEDLIRAKERPSHFGNYDSRHHVLDSSFNDYYTVMRSQMANLYGFKSKLTAWSLRDQIGAHQFSENSVEMMGPSAPGDPNTNFIETGWHVDPVVYNDTFSRFYTYWTIDNYKTGCLNLECKGFVQTSAVYAPGFALTAVSTYGGQQEYFDFQIQKDPQYGMWWLQMEGFDLGYWPKEIFTNFDFSIRIDFGGTVSTPKNEASPAMGNGHFPEEGIGKACYFMDVQFIGEDWKPFIPDPVWSTVYNTAPDKLYRIRQDPPTGSWNVAYGGPGGLV